MVPDIMADEFFAPLSDGQARPALSVIAQDLQALTNYTVERISEKESSLRFSGTKRRDDWPEDFTVSYEHEGVLITMHAANRDERTMLLRDLEKAFHRYGLVVSFDPA
jgi:hypothetical protein